MNTLRPFLASCVALWASAVCAQYKVVGPDGTVTYTDRPPPDAKAQAVPVSGVGGRVDAANLPRPCGPSWAAIRSRSTPAQAVPLAIKVARC
ncbi:DUF4124 domain-containing protein [Ideonella paludis]|uniref:DUF4124 domain-containing protein n=1 Tax=Ideonella paludis TaxID=1233411 RepID=UPI00362D573E